MGFAQLHVLKGVFVKQVKILSRYIGSIVTIAVMPYMIGGLFTGIGYAVGGPSAQRNFVANTGISNPLLYMVLGGSIMLAAMIIMENVGSVIREEQLIGTFELHYLTPNNFILLWFYHIIPVALLMIMIFAFNVTPILLYEGGILSPIEWVVASFVVFLSMVPLVGVGLVIAALTVRFKEVDAVINVINSGITLLSGFFYPLEIFPRIIQEIAALVPTSHAVELLREIVAYKSIPLDTPSKLLVLAVLSVVYLAVGSITYKRWEEHAKRTGELSKY
ncbi:MAG: hypothetical protein DRJ35_03695 [Thermoprotei archaeon]|nr:MAG: hypothetical protein DRJ35_03695 [Thermoprotei archaeon]